MPKLFSVIGILEEESRPHFEPCMLAATRFRNKDEMEKCSQIEPAKLKDIDSYLESLQE